MRYGFIALCVLTASAQASQSVVLTGGAVATGTFPNSAPFTAVTNIRIEFRVFNYAAPIDFNGEFFQWGSFAGRFFPQSAPYILTFIDNYDGANMADGGATNINLTNSPQDLLVRFQRDVVNSRVSLEIWNASNGQGYQYVTEAITAAPVTANLGGATVDVGSTTVSTDLAFLRVYSTVLPLNSPPPQTTNGNLADWEFEGNLNDSSSYATNLSGTVTYTTTPAYPIYVSFGGYGSQRVWNTNYGSLSLASNSFSSVDNPAYTYLWSLTTGPGSGTFSAPTSSTTLFTAATPGDYLINLQAGDGVTTGNAAVDMGGVNANPNNIVKISNPSMSTALGLLSMWGTAPWPWYDYTEMADADALYGLLTTAPTYGATALTGTVAVTNTGTSVVGSGTHFFADIIGCNPAGGSPTTYTCTNPNISSYAAMSARDYFFIPDVTCSGSPTLNINGLGAVSISGSCTAGIIYQITYTGSAFSTAVAYPVIWLFTNAPDGNGTGRVWGNVASITDNTHLTLYSQYNAPTTSGVQYSNPSAPELGVYWNYVSQPSNSINYYDACFAVYKLYYRTNLTKYQTEAQTCADLWYKYATWQGYYAGPPRAIGYLGLIARAIDGHPTIWQAVDLYIQNSVNNAIFTQTSPQPVGYSFDTRESGYMTRFIARAAALDPDAGINAIACTYLHNAINNVYYSAQDSSGQWEIDQYSENPGVPQAKLANSSFGSAPWRDAMSGLGLEDAYGILPTACSDSATALVAIGVVEKEASLLKTQGEGRVSWGTGSGYGQMASINYGSMGNTQLHAVNSQGSPGQYVMPYSTGYVTVVNGSPNVVGTGTNFTTIFSAIYGMTTPVNGVDPQFIGIPGSNYGSPQSTNSSLPVLSVTDDTHLTLSVNWPSASSTVNAGSYSSVGWIGTPAAYNTCSGIGSAATTCEAGGGPVAADPSLAHEMHALWGWLYWKTGNQQYKTWAQQSAGTDYGGSAGGPGSSIAASGPYALDATGNFLSPLPVCGSAPCGGDGAVAALGKDFGFSAGAGNANNAMAYLLQPVPNVTVSGQVALSGAAVVQ